MHKPTLCVCLFMGVFFSAMGAHGNAQACSDGLGTTGATQLSNETVYFATNRKAQNQSFDSERGPLSFGSASVAFKENVPHKFFDGMESPLEWKLSIQPLMPEDSWSAKISAAVNSGKPFNGMRPTDSVIVYIHGFANDFHDALCRAAEIKHRTRFEGQVVLFSWPASSKITALNAMFAGEKYDHDVDEANASIADLIQVLNELQRIVPPSRTVLVAHSMGNQLLLKAILRSHPTANNPYRAVVFLAPDVSVDDLLHALPTVNLGAKRVALYVNRNDLALMSSAGRHLNSRAGATEVVDVSGKMETVDITQATSEYANVLHHADHLDGTALYDLFWNIVRDMPVKCRTERGLAYRDGLVWRLEVQDQPYDAKALDPICDVRTK